jgi:hypothetical protein
LPWLRGGKGHNRVELPAFQQLAESFDSRNVVSGCGSQAIANIEIAAGVFLREIVAVLRV